MHKSATQRYLLARRLVLAVQTVLSFAVMAAEPAPRNEIAVLSTRTATFRIDAAGSLCAIDGNGRNYLPPAQPAPVLQLRIDGQDHAPDKAGWDEASQQLTLHYGASGAVATVKVATKTTHVSLELVAVKPAERIEAVIWGPYPTTIHEIIGEVVGVVRDAGFAVGIQALNLKTLGGLPGDEADISKGYECDDPGHYPDLPAELNQKQQFRGTTACPAPFGSVLQAYCRDRRHSRTATNWGVADFVIPPLLGADATVTGSKIAVFACRAPDALATLGEIELAEGLPHPLQNGVWTKMSPTANASYLIMDFNESNIDRAIAMTRRAGLSCLYHSGPFRTWGHFELRTDQFPHGWAGLKTCADKARRQGVSIGFHTLSNFIRPGDAYVTPKPDHRLAQSGAAVLTADIAKADREISVESPTPFARATCMNTVRIDDELIQFKGVSPAAPWKLLGCTRGAFGTMPAPHPHGSTVAKLMDHPYKVFLTDTGLAAEVARKIAELCNFAGIGRISMDGLEGAFSTGHGDYGRQWFAKSWYDALSPELRGRVINDASNPSHFNWHINTYYNWGEPWYAGFRESQTLYRFKNQLFYERNLLPRMLGWFSLRRNTTLADAEWMLARAAGYNAGFALATSPEFAGDQVPSAGGGAPSSQTVNPILDAIREWEAARLAGAFPEAIRAQLRDNQREFQLAAAGPGQWDLYPMDHGQRGAPVRLKAKN